MHFFQRHHYHPNFPTHPIRRDKKFGLSCGFKIHFLGCFCSNLFHFIVSSSSSSSYNVVSLPPIPSTTATSNGLSNGASGGGGGSDSTRMLKQSEKRQQRQLMVGGGLGRYASKSRLDLVANLLGRDRREREENERGLFRYAG
jgi:hypothetical protein